MLLAWEFSNKAIRDIILLNNREEVLPYEKVYID